jgi:hypothetical protein
MGIAERIRDTLHWLETQRSATQCRRCGRRSRKRVGEKVPRRPLDWYPLESAGPKKVATLEQMANAGASPYTLETEMTRRIALCQPCFKRMRTEKLMG